MKTKEQAIADEWNRAHQVGTPVIRYKLIGPFGLRNQTKTRSQAWVMGGHSVMVMVEGIAGGVLLESVVPCAPSIKADQTEVEI